MSVTRDGVVYELLPSDLTDAASSCATTAQSVAERLDALRKYVVSMEDFWRGPAATQFGALMADYDANAAKLHQALTAISEGLSGTHGNYVDAETAASHNVSRIQLPPPRW
ncbi:WXG100 family type VII secretion target [Streptomyces sp. KL116D]|uniref:WXG100 family type VII secretion target n=1 Tax=Streptomyces sp. KL116D TaxID=3045152 RepID=UPI003556ADDC